MAYLLENFDKLRGIQKDKVLHKFIGYLSVVHHRDTEMWAQFEKYVAESKSQQVPLFEQLTRTEKNAIDNFIDRELDKTL